MTWTTRGMSQAESTSSQIDALQQTHHRLLQDYLSLQIEVAQQQAQAEQWLAQRTRELQVEALEQKKAETLQRVFYRIAERATAGLSFFEFSRVVHHLLDELIYARNCYVCLYNAQRQTLDFPYYVDERDGDTMQCNGVPYRRGLTEFVLRSGQAQHIDAQRFAALQASGEVTEASGDLSFTSWLGVPMQIRGTISGVLVVQRYEPGQNYSAADADILTFVANHFGSAIERYQAIDDLRKSEKRYRTVIEKVGVGVVVIQAGRVVFANPSMMDITGHQQEYLASRPYTDFLHPDDKPAVAAHYARHQRGESPGADYAARIITAAGQVRWLEFSAVGIEWNKRPATLLFAIDASQRREAEEIAHAALQKQAELNNMKANFIALASHEFRTPLATIHGSVELLRHYDQRLSLAQKSNSLEKIDEAVQRMMKMLENVLLIGSAESRQLAFRPQAVALTPFCLGLIDELKNSMRVRFDQVTLTLDLPPPDKLYWLDDKLLRHIVGNLLGNALKYSPSGGQVRLTASSQANRLTLCVSDEGIGIPAVDIPLLFERFHRASNVGQIAGTGLGLSIVKDAVDAHQGQIQVASQLDQGSCFTITLPLLEQP